MKKPSSIIIVLISIFIFGVITANAATWTVTKSTNSNDGVCDADCSLREAIAVSASNDRIIFNSNLVGQTFTLGGSFLSIPAGKTIEIDGNLDGTNVVLLSGSNTSFHFFINETATVSLKNIILTEGRGGQSGSVFCSSCNLSLDRVSIRNSRGGNYAAIGFVQTNGNVVNTQIITNSSITSNTTLGGVGSIISVNPQSTLYMSNTTVSGNRIEEDDGFSYGGIYIARNAFIRNCTIVNNTTTGRGGGIVVAQGLLDIGNTIIARNTADIEGQDMYLFGNNTDVISRGGNLIGDTDTLPGGIFIQTNDAVNLNPLLAPFNSNQGGHPISTHPLQAGSPARNTGINSVAVNPLSNLPLDFDARGNGFPRIAGSSVDKGAFEDQTNGSSLVVSKLTNSSDNVCDTDCSLREAVYAASVDPGADNITMAANVFGTMIVGTEIDIENNDVNIIGYPSLDSNTLIVSGNNTSRVFNIDNSNVTMTGFTIANGNGAGSSQPFGGGGLIAYRGNLTLNQMIIRNNAPTASDLGSGGGIATYEVNVVRIMNSTISNNSSYSSLGAKIDASVIYITNTTIANNSYIPLDAPGFGALTINGSLYMRNSTIANNRSAGSTTGAGLYCNGASTCNVGNSIFADNTATNGNDLFVQTGGTLQSVGGNLVENNTGFNNGAMSQQNDVISVDPMLMSLADNGGNVPTMMLNPASPAINGGINSNATDPFSAAVLATDARGSGYTRIVSTVDKGAFETLVPTAAGTTVSGRVTNGKSGVPNAQVYISGQNGVLKTTTTNSLGYFSFDEIEVGQLYIVSATSKQYQFNSRVINVMDEVSDLELIAY